MLSLFPLPSKLDCIYVLTLRDYGQSQWDNGTKQPELQYIELKMVQIIDWSNKAFTHLFWTSGFKRQHKFFQQ